MKKALLYLLLFSYITCILKPVLPTISDSIAHIFWYSEHMATVHYEHGKYHVHMEYTAAAKKGFPEKATVLKADEPGNLYFSAVPEFDITVYPLLQHTFIRTASSLAEAFPGAVYPPPKPA